MNLRTRLVLALVALLTVGLAVFGWVTTTRYARSQEDQLDSELDAAAGPLGRQLTDDRAQPSDHGPGPSDVYAALVAEDGEVLDEIQPFSTDDTPELPDGEDRYATVGSADGSTEWRVLTEPAPGPHGDGDGDRVMVAIPTDQVQDSVARLVRIEVAAGAGLLVLLAAGSWLILRRGLRPLERMAATTRTVTAGDLATRVALADDRSEVGQLGLALNSMLTRLEDAFAEREATEQRLRQFLADASHELRTPLTSIQGFAELFRLGARQDEVDLALAMRRIEEDAGRMRGLVDDLLLLARLDQTRPLERAPVDLAVLAAEACSAAAAADPERPITLDAPRPVVVEGDGDHLRQAIGNLVTNAVRHTPAGTPVEVTVTVSDDAGQGTVQVRDHGPGLDGDGLAHAFDRFWQANPSRSSAGAGLGLSIVAAIVAEHGGTARVANADGGGAVFRLDLPL